MLALICNLGTDGVRVREFLGLASQSYSSLICDLQANENLSQRRWSEFLKMCLHLHMCTHRMYIYTHCKKTIEIKGNS